jgi:hypothetical protein
VILCGLFPLVAGCRAPQESRVTPPPSAWLYAGDEPVPLSKQDDRFPRPFPLDWQPGQVLLQGHLGASYLSDWTLDGDGTSVEIDDDDYEVLPAIGGGAQLKLFGRTFDLGLEGLIGFSGRSSLEAFASSGGTAVAAFDVTLLVFELYGGPFVSTFLGERLRLYAAGGPLLAWVSYDPDDDDVANPADDDADGSGGGVYARAGFEFLLPSGRLVGLGARWSDASLDLDPDFDDLDVSRLEVFFSYSYGLEPGTRLTW